MPESPQSTVQCALCTLQSQQALSSIGLVLRSVHLPTHAVQGQNSVQCATQEKAGCTKLSCVLPLLLLPSWPVLFSFFLMSLSRLRGALTTFCFLSYAVSLSSFTR